MQALSDEQQIDRVEQKVDRLDAKVDHLDAKFDAKVDRLDAKFDTRIAGVREEGRDDFRMLLAAQLTTLVAMVLGFAGLFLQMS